MVNKKELNLEKPSPSNVYEHFSPGVRAMVFRLEYRHCHTLVRRYCQASWQPIATRCSLKDKGDYWYKEDILLAERNRRRSLKHHKQSINISVLSTKRVCFLASVTGGKVFLKLWALKQLLLEHSKQLIPESVWFKETKPTNNDYIMKEVFPNLLRMLCGFEN